MDTVFLGLGANLGDRRANIDMALREIGRVAKTAVEATAAPIETDPVGGPPGQGKYLNTVCRVRTGLEPPALLCAIQAIERGLGRERAPGAPRWGPRPIDIDILLWGDRIVDLPELTIPHPRIAERRFVLVPLAELDPEARHPLLGVTVGELLERIQRPYTELDAKLRKT